MTSSCSECATIVRNTPSDDKNTSEMSQIPQPDRVVPLPANCVYRPLTLDRMRALNDAIVNVLSCRDRREGADVSAVVVPVVVIEELRLQQELFLDLVDFGTVRSRPWHFNVPGCS